jgi:hypothetical protein
LAYTETRPTEVLEKFKKRYSRPCSEIALHILFLGIKPGEKRRKGKRGERGKKRCPSRAKREKL